jgi:hypothetical protein
MNTQARVAYRCIRPAAAAWLVDRVDGISLTLGRQVVQADSNGAGVELTLDDGSKRHPEDIVLGTGYVVDVAREPMFGGSIRESLVTKRGYPLVSRGTESSIPGLHFAGAYTALSLGPIMRFVSGTRYAARGTARRIAGSNGRGRKSSGSRSPDLAEASS